LNLRDCVDESACRWNLQSKRCEDYDGHLCAELVTRQSCHAADACAWSHYNKTCVERVFVEDTCAKYGNSLKNCQKDSNCFFKQKVGCLAKSDQQCTFYGTRKVCKEDQRCLWKHDPINGGNCVAQPDPCPDLKNPKLCFGNNQCKWIKKKKKCVKK
jgi:hypothetical protein